MEQLQIFNSDKFGNIRTIMAEDEPWFVAVDICKALELSNVSKAMQRLDSDERANFKLGVHDSDGTNCVNEYGLYNLVLASRKKEAKEFKRWITHDVIPSIRRTGGYEMPKTTAGQIKLLAQGYSDLEQKLEGIDKDLQDFKQDMPLLAVECEKITRAVKAKGTEILGGRNSNAYRDKSLRTTVYRDIHNEIRRQFGVDTYKAIKRSQCDKAIEIINNYVPPMVLAEQIADANAQISF